MSHATASTIQAPTDGDEMGADAVFRLTNRIVAACHGENTPATESGLISLPSERDLSTRLNMSRHAVRNALAQLQRKGIVCRPGGRGPLLLAQTMPAAARASEPRCINVVLNSGLDTEGLSWLRDEYLTGYTEVLDHYDCKTRHVVWRPEEENFESLLWCHASPQQQGCLVVGLRDPVLLDWLTEHGVPFVVQNYCLYDHHALAPHHKVYVNKTGAAFEATRHLIELGHRRIGFVGALPGPDRSWPEYEGYQAALRCAGITPDPQEAVDLNTQAVERALPACHRLLARDRRPTAVVAGVGAITIALLQSARSLSIDVPGELSIVGFDDAKTPSFPELSTINVPRRSLGQQAMALLLDAVKQPNLAPQTRVVECQVNYRQTTGPVPARAVRRD